MPTADLRIYRFRRRAHWARCGLDGVVVDGDALTAPGGGAWQPLSVAAEDRDALALASDPSGRLGWLRRSGELALWEDGEVTVLGRLDGAEPARLAFGAQKIWLATGGWLRIYDRLHLQELSAHRIDPVLALAADRAGGAWCLVRAAPEGCRWLHFDRSGRADGRAVACPDRARVLDGALDPCSGRLVVVDRSAVRSRGPCDDGWSTDIDLCPWHCRFEPDLISIGCHHIRHLLDRTRGLLWSFAENGVRAAQREVQAGTQAIAGGLTPALGGAYGIVQLSAAVPGAAGGDREAAEAVLLTPTLVSPREHGATWQRARVEAELPPGTVLRVRVAASDDDRLAERVAEIAARPGLNPTQQLLALDGLLPWDPNFETALAAADDPLNRGWFDVVLDGIKGPYLWLNLRLHVPPTSPPARLRQLEVRYPARSWIEDLPAIYRADPVRATELRRFLAVFETVFDDLEARIEELPEQLATAPATDQAWADFLLRWLGLPLPADLPADRKRAFLARAPELLRWRGTPRALQEALRIVTGCEVRIGDLGAGPLPWVLRRDRTRLAADDSQTDREPEEPLECGGPRLGADTLLIRQDQPGFVLGGAARLKRDALGRHDATAAGQVAQRTQMLRIEIDGVLQDEAGLNAAIEATLGHFLPASCRCDLRLARLGAAGQGHLDRDARVMDPRATIGRTARLGRSALAIAAPPAIRLDDRAILDGRHRLL
jgi:phage tail-like protein